MVLCQSKIIWRGGKPPGVRIGSHSGESVEQIQPDLIIPTGRRRGRSPSVASIYRALAEHTKGETYPDAVEQAHTDYAELRAVCDGGAARD